MSTVQIKRIMDRTHMRRDAKLTSVVGEKGKGKMTKSNCRLPCTMRSPSKNRISTANDAELELEDGWAQMANNEIAEMLAFKTKKHRTYKVPKRSLTIGLVDGKLVIE